MKIFLVGGAVRDHIMNVICKDRDYVIVGSSPEEMLSLGYSQVGADFPVFLHPITNEEYALARTERKSGKGYHGFTVDFSKEVTLEDDLARRDLTMNSMAMDLETNEVIDPFNGQQDIKNKIIRHTSDAFADDPVRVLRTARFAARYNFDIHQDTLNFMSSMVAKGDLNDLTKERVWKEFEKGLMEKTPSIMIETIRKIGASRILNMYIPIQFSRDEVFSKWMYMLDFACSLNAPLSVRFTIVCGAPFSDFLEEWKIPTEQGDVCRLVQKNLPVLVTYEKMTPHDKIRLFQTLDYYRRPERFLEILSAASYITLAAGFGHLGICDNISPINIMYEASLTKKIDGAYIASSTSDKSKIKDAIFDARVFVLQLYYQTCDRF